MAAKRKREVHEETICKEPDRKIIMAVDFGTTYSGLAWAQTRKPEMQTPIIQWPDATSGGLEGITSDKVPSEIQYDGSNFKWGFQIDEDGERHRWFKLGLDPSQTRRDWKPESKYADPMDFLPKDDIATEKLVTGYLTALRKHAEQVLRYKLPKSALETTPLEFVITVPAVWSDAAHAKTRKCAENAGMGRGSALHIISEPEAAAIYALDAMDPHDIKVGDTFVLCDAGGGTVDLISYRVLALRPLLKIEEASPGSGSLCGSSYLNRIFRRLLYRKFRRDTGWENDATKRFETVVKRSFRGTNGEEFQIPVPGLANNVALGVRRGRLRMTGAEVKEIFEPVVKEVVNLVLDQIKATKSSVKAVLMVGGFGQSAYLRDRIRAAVGDIEVMQSPNGWTAVVRGALMKGLASTSPKFATVRISGRSARKHYGLEVTKPFNIAIHDLSRRFWCEYHGDNAINTMEWFITKGSTVKEDQPVLLSYYNHQLVSEGRPNLLKAYIDVCSDPSGDGAPLYHNTNVVRLVKLVANLSSVPVHHFPTKIGEDGEVYYIIDYKIAIVYLSAYTKYELIHRNINYGAVAAEYV